MRTAKKKLRPARILLIALLMMIIGFGVWYIWHVRNNVNGTLDATTNNGSQTSNSVKAKATTPTDQAYTTPTTPTNANQPIGMKPDISKWDPAGFITASYSRKLTDFTPWQDSPVTPTTKDFNGDGVNDIFVWAKLPGTNGYSFAAVWTLGSNDKPKELWYVPSQQVYLQSSWSVSGTNLVEVGKLNTPNGYSNETNTYHWQNNTFVTY